MPGTIERFQGDFRFLSNFWQAPVAFRCGMSTWPYPTAEHAFQAQKANNASDLQRICTAGSPGDAKRAGRLVQWSPGQQETWDRVKKRVMLEIVTAKFNQNDHLRDLLMLTMNARLIEGNHWHDNFWGACDCASCAGTDDQWWGDRGRNYLGQILMAVRMVLREDA